MHGELVLLNIMIKINFFLILSLVLFGCNDMNSTKIIDKEFTFNFIKTQNLKDVTCKYMGTKFTEKILTSLD